MVVQVKRTVITVSSSVAFGTAGVGVGGLLWPKLSEYEQVKMTLSEAVTKVAAFVSALDAATRQ